MQFFKGDPLEKKFYEAARPLVANRSLNKTNMYNDLYNCFILGDAIISQDFAPLSNQIPSEFYRASFPQIMEAFIKGGSFEAYLEVFRAIFGPETTITFTVPAPGKLTIAITADGTEDNIGLLREIVDDEYVFFDLKDHEDPENDIIFRTVKGFLTQYELERLLFEMVPSGVFTSISLTLGD